MTLTIDLYCNDGSPLRITPPDIYGRGVGGAELAMMSWAETMAARGHRIRVYNNPDNPGIYNGVEYLPQNSFAPRELRDVFIVYRSPNPYIRIANAHVKLFWSCDQYTQGNFTTDVFPWVDRTVCISPFHVAYHREHYQVEEHRIGYFDLGVRLQDYEGVEAEKVPGRCIYCSVPDRGLELLRQLWPKIKERVPHASLVITSDYRLWGALTPMNQEHRMKWLYEQDVQFMGKVERRELVKQQLAAEVMAYPGTYDELFCISAAECQVAGATPITSTTGALITTNQWGLLVPGNMATRQWQDIFVKTVAMNLIENNESKLMREATQLDAKKRFNWRTICSQWERLIQTGEYATKAKAKKTRQKKELIAA